MSTRATVRAHEYALIIHSTAPPQVSDGHDHDATVANRLLNIAPGNWNLLFIFPTSVQTWAARSISMGLTAKIPFLKNYVESRSYLFNVRFVGLLAYVSFVLLAVAAYRGHGDWPRRNG